LNALPGGRKRKAQRKCGKTKKGGEKAKKA